MKKVLLIIQILLVATDIGFAQVSYEGKLDANMKAMQLSDGTLKFFKLDPDENKLLVFSTDNSLWKSINLPVPKGHSIDEITIIKGVSDEDGQQLTILFTCFYHRTYPIEDVSRFHSRQIFTVNVIDESGNFLLKVPEASDYKLLSTNGNNKLLVYKTQPDGLKSKRLLEVYGFDDQID
ncbi:MAG: hypothetical protein V2I62_11220 [Bacteroidales bacterium]|jgi:hypothetical protein|nr:hypothetical protein [Bacteroidales bacterium]